MLIQVDDAVHDVQDALSRMHRQSPDATLETIVSALATLAGERLLLSAGHAAPDTAAAWRIVKCYALKAGVAEHDLPEPVAIESAAEAAIGAVSLPPLSVPRTHFPRDRSANAIPHLRATVRRVQDAHRLRHGEMADALCHVIGQTIVRARETLEPAIATTLATEVLIGTTRLSPLAEEMRLAMRRVA